MIQIERSSTHLPTWLRLGIVLIVIIAVASIATAVLGASGPGPVYDISPDPMDPLWHW